MDWVHIHLVVNHFPIILGVVGAAAALIAAVTRKHAVWLYAYVTVGLAAVSAPVAFLTGQEAEHPAELLPGVSRTLIHRHEDAAAWALVLTVIAGFLAVRAWKKGKVWIRWAFLLAAIFAAGTMVYTGLEGGLIEHAGSATEQATPRSI